MALPLLAAAAPSIQSNPPRPAETEVTETWRVLERLRIGHSTCEIIDRGGDDGLRMRISEPGQLREFGDGHFLLGPPISPKPAEKYDEMLARLARAADPNDPAPRLKRCLIIGPRGQPFFAFTGITEVCMQHVCTTVIPIEAGSIALDKAFALDEGSISGAWDDLRAWKGDFKTVNIFPPYVSTLGQVCMRWDGHDWQVDAAPMRRPALKSTELAEMARQLRKDWPKPPVELSHESLECLQLAQAMATLIYGGNARQAEELQSLVLHDNPATLEAFAPLFVRELHAGSRHIAMLRTLNGGSLGAFERMDGITKPEAAARPTTP